MLVLLLIFPVLFAYLGYGAKYARNLYALEHYAWSQEKPSLEISKARIVALQDKLNNIDHRSYCFTLISSRHPCQNCTETNSSNYRKWSSEIAQLQGKLMSSPEPTVGISDVFAWPYTSFGNYLRGGTVKKPDYNLIASLEATELKELQ